MMGFFVIMYALSSSQDNKFEAQASIIRGSLGICPAFPQAPILKHLPAPAIKQNTRTLPQTRETPQPGKKSSADASTSASQEASQTAESYDEEVVRGIKALGLGLQGELEVSRAEEEYILTLPTYGLFDKNSYTIDPNSPEVKRVGKLYQQLAKRIAALSQYDVYFVGHTDALPINPQDNSNAPKNNVELGFRRAMEIYQYFFAEDLQDKTRVTFASQGDNEPLIPNAQLDSERRKNRRVQIHLKKRSPHLINASIKD